MARINRGYAAAGAALAVMAALAEIGSFLMDNGGFISRTVIEMVRPTKIAAPLPACPPDKNPLVEIFCRDKRDGTIRLEP